MIDLMGQVVLVTGASGNLGQAAARAFAAAGATLVLVDRSTGRLGDLFPDQYDDDLLLVAEGVNLAREEEIAAVCAKALERFGRLDALFNTVGAYRGGTPVTEESAATWSLLYEVNVSATLNACRAVLPAMLDRGRGAIVNTASRDGLRGAAGSAAYGAAKAAVLRLTESLAAEVGPSGVRVNAVVPGTLDTPQNRQGTPDADFKRWVEPSAVADVAVFLASDRARAVNGATVPVLGLS